VEELFEDMEEKCWKMQKSESTQEENKKKNRASRVEEQGSWRQNNRGKLESEGGKGSVAGE